MSNENKGKWGRNNWDRRGRGGPNRGFGRGRGSWRGNYFQRGAYGGPGGHRNNDRNSQGDWNCAQRKWKRPQRDSPGKRLSEDAIGVTKYISDHQGFNGIIKSRYSDFQVSEINEQGEIAKLTCFEPPQPPADETVDEDEDLLLSKYNLEILPMETWDSINKLVTSQESTENIEIDASNMSKEQRTKIHDAVKKAFGESIVGSTVNIDDKKLLRFQKYRKGVRIDNRVKWIWPGEYTYFVVYKENCDTMDAAARIAERLRLNIKPSMVGYAGSKDRRAVTSQWFSLRKVDPRRIAGFCRGLKDVHVGNFAFSNQTLRLGMLKGNKFRIALRNVTASDECIDEACKLLQENGFINYYGLQRFGTRVETPTYDIGMKMLQGNFKEAINGILQERSGPLQPALQRYREAGVAAAALQALPRGAHVEARLLKALAKAPNDILGALGKLARNTRLLYLHAYQSLIWNRAVSERIGRFGLEPAAGDLVLAGAGAGAGAVLVEELNEGEFDEEDNLNESESDFDSTDTKTETLTEDTDSKKDSNKNPEDKPKIPVKVLTKEDVESGKYTIFDIIMPLPGYHIEYPPNMKEFYEEQLAKDGLKLELRNKIKPYSMSGAYRAVVVRPLGAEWRCVRYDQPFADLIRSDLDEINGRVLTGVKEDGKFKALLLTMSLPASCYATMALRELLKVDTSCDYQALQNNYHKRKNSNDKPDQSGDETSKEEAENPKDGVETPKNEDESLKNDVESLENEVESPEVEDESPKEEETSKIENGVKRKLESDDDSDGKKMKTEVDE